MSTETNQSQIKPNFFARFKTKEFWLKVLEYSIPAMISIAIFLFAMIIKGIAPFGKNSLSYIDYNEGLVPSYTGLWDFLHGKASFLATFKLGAGGYLYASYISNSFLSPISWLIALFPRTQIQFGIAFLLIVKFALMSTTAYICFKKMFSNINRWVLVMFSIVWTYSGWTIIHFTNIGWLDLMILLPLLVLASRQLVKEGKMMWFVIILSYMLCLSYYISYMILVGVVAIATVYYFTMADKSTRKRTASLLFYGIVISILISFVAFIPSCFTSLQAHRFAGTNEYGKSDLYLSFFSKVSILLMQALPVVFFIKLITTIKKDKRNVLFFLLSFCVCGLGIIIEPINKMWHTGSYYCFPFRYSFVLVLLIIFGALYYLNKYTFSLDTNSDSEKVEDKTLTQDEVRNVKEVKDVKIETNNVKEKKTKKCVNFYTSVGGYILLFLSIIFFVVSLIMFVMIGVGLSSYRALHISAFMVYLLNFLSLFYLILYVGNIKNKKLYISKLSGGILVAVLCLIQTCTLVVSFTGSPFGSNPNTSRINNTFNIDVSNFDEGYKVKDADALYNTNFEYFIDYPTLQSWIHISSEEQYQAYHYTGYNTFSTEVLSSGGTYLTDVLLGNKYILSLRELDSRYYTLLGQFDYYVEGTKETLKVNCYQLNFSLKPAWTTNTDLSTINDKESDIVDNQNTLYKALYSQTNNIMEYTTYTYEITEDKVVVTINNVPNHNLYMISKDITFGIKFNDNIVNIKNGFNDFGISQSTQCVAEIEFDEDDKLTDEEVKDIFDNIKFATFDVETFKSIHESLVNTDDVKLSINKNKLNINVNNTSNSKYLFIPYINLKNMKVTINNQSSTVSNAIFNFMQLDLNDGENVIAISNQPQLLLPCALITLVSIIVFVVCSICNHRFKFSENKVIVWIGVGGAVVILGVVGLFVYLKPFINTFVILFS